MNEQGQRVTLGVEPTYDPDDRMVCPNGHVQEDDEYQPGYGLAYGGGLGTYYYCTTEGCDWFWKVLDWEESHI